MNDDKFHDECGVFGIYGHAEAPVLTRLGLYALQHRGQESAGIAAADGERLSCVRAMGQVSEAFDERDLSTLKGHSGIGHVRYSTAGDSRIVNAQPLLIECAHGEIALCHNGNLVNAAELRSGALSMLRPVSRALVTNSVCTGRPRSASKRRAKTRAYSDVPLAALRS